MNNKIFNLTYLMNLKIKMEDPINYLPWTKEIQERFRRSSAMQPIEVLHKRKQKEQLTRWCLSELKGL